jgi:hypothetical protein
MKLLLTLMIAGTALFAGGDIIPVKVVTKFEKLVVVQKAQPTRGCYKPNIKKCPDCVDVAELCPDDPQLPLAKTETCEGLIRQQAGH